MPDQIALREACIVHRTRIPQHEIARLKIDLGHLASKLLKPLDVLFLEDEQVFEIFLLWWLILVVVLLTSLGEELIKELAGTLHNNETSIIRSVWLVIEKALNALHPFTVWRLVTVRPRGPGEVFLARKGYVLTIE